MIVQFQKLHPDAVIPKRAKSCDAGYDLFPVRTDKINPCERKIIWTGIAVAIPPGYYGRIAPRSGLAAKHGIDVMGGVIDSGYRNELGVILINHELKPWLELLASANARAVAHSSLFGLPGAFDVKLGVAVAQLIIENCADAEFVPVSELPPSERGEAGFGSTNK